MRWVLIGGLLLLGLLAGVAGAADGPLADAGLDQSVTQGATVHLDAGGSTAPDGEITSYEWTIERPNGTETTPECSSCARTRFVANQAGTYAVTVEVTSDDGATDRDTLYVEVSAREMPEATLEGPTTLTAGEAGTFSIDGQAGDAPLSSYTWRIDGESRDPEPWVSKPATTITFGAPGKYTITATVTDTAGYDSRVKQTVVVEPGDSDGETASSPTGGQSEGSAGNLGTTYDRMFVDDDGDVYLAVGDEMGERDEFSMYLPNGRELQIDTEQISKKPGTWFDNPDIVQQNSYLEFERTVADLEYFEAEIKKSGYSLNELKKMMPQSECRVSDEEVQRCVEQEMRLLNKEGQEKQGQLFANVGQSWIDKEFDGHPELGPTETRAPYTKHSVENHGSSSVTPSSQNSAGSTGGSVSDSDTQPNPVPSRAENLLRTSIPDHSTEDRSQRDSSNDNGSSGAASGGNSKPKPDSSRDITVV